MKKRILSFILCLSLLATMVLVAIPVSAAETMTMTALADSGNAAVSGDVVTIASADELDAFASYVSANKNTEGVTFILLNDITYNTGDASVWASTEPDNKYIPAGDYSKPFKGIFEGNNKTISGLYVNTTSSYIGFIGSLADGTVQNLAIVNSYIFTSSYGAGAVIGAANAGVNQISNVYVDATIKATGSQNSYAFVGGIAGLINSGSTLNISNVVVKGSVDGGSAGGIGGIVGETIDSIVNLDCVVNCAEVNGMTAIGGIIGYVSSTFKVSIIRNAVNAGVVSTEAGFCGDIIGRNNSATTAEIYSSAAVKNMNTSTTNYGGTVGYIKPTTNTVTYYDSVSDMTDLNSDIWSNTDSGLLPTTVYTMLSNAPTKIVAQATSKDGGTYSVRFLAVVDTLDYTAAAFSVKATLEDGTQKEFFMNVTDAYTSVLAYGDEVTAESLGGNYILAYAITGIDEEPVDFEVTVITVSNGIYSETAATFEDVAAEQ